MHYHITGMHTPGRTGVWERYLEETEKDPTLAYGPGRGAIGSPETVREFLRGYEESGIRRPSRRKPSGSSPSSRRSRPVARRRWHPTSTKVTHSADSRPVRVAS